MKILYINHYAGSIYHGMEFRPFYLARQWVRSGHQVQIVAASHSHLRARQPVLTEATLDEQIEGVQYRWYDTPKYLGNGLGRVKNMLAFLWALWRDARRLAKEFQPDVVIASSTYPMDIWPAERIAKLAGAKLVYEVHDLWPLSPMELGGMSRWHPFIIWVQWAEDYAYRHADIVVSMLPNVADYVRKKGFPLERLAIVPNGVSLDDWASEIKPLNSELEKAIKSAQTAGESIVAYTGSHGIPNALDTLLDAAALLLKEPFRFVIVGDGHERTRLLNRVREEGLLNVQMYEPIAKAEVVAFLAKADMAYLGAPRQPLYRFGVSPNKMIDYMMAGVPILFAIEAGNNPIALADCGVELAAENSAALAAAIRQMADLPPERRRVMGENGRRYALAHHAYDVLANLFLNAVNAASFRK